VLLTLKFVSDGKDKSSESEGKFCKVDTLARGDGERIMVVPFLLGNDRRRLYAACSEIR
jgi:hypothetical protein